LKAATPGIGIGLSRISGALIVENSVIDGWYTGIQIIATDPVSISGTTVRNNESVGIRVAANATVSIDDSRLVGNGSYIGGAGLAADAGTVSVDRSECFGSYVCLWFRNWVSAATGSVRRTLVSGSSFGIASELTAQVQISQVAVTANTVGLTPSGIIASFGNNEIRNNGTNVVGGTLTPVTLQ
jgi:hypothetical protein